MKIIVRIFLGKLKSYISNRKIFKRFRKITDYGSNTIATLDKQDTAMNGLFKGIDINIHNISKWNVSNVFLCLP
jgi:hypothetical protein